MSDLDSAKREAFDDIRNRAEKLRTSYSERDGLLEQMRQMYHMEWDDIPSEPWIKPTMSTTAYDALTGAVRLMTSTEPQFNVRFDEADEELRQASSAIEAAARSMWSGSGRVTGRPVHYEMILSSLWAGEIVGTVTRTADLVDATRGMRSSRRYARQAEQAQRETPYLFQIHNPVTCYTEYTMLGPSAVLRRAETTWGDVLGIYGRAAEEAAGSSRRKSDDRVTVWDWTDYDWRAVWVDQMSEPVMFTEMGLDFLPVISQVTDGSFLWDRPEQQRTPFLYGLLRSGIWRRENLMLTVVYSMIHGLGSNPQLVYETDNPEDDKIFIDRQIPGGVVNIRKGNRLAPLTEKVIDPAQMQGLQMAQQIAESTTIPRVALGAPPSGNLAFSTVSTLIQSGRLPLMGTKQQAAHAASEMVRRALLWLKASAEEPGRLIDMGNGAARAERATDEMYDGHGQRIDIDPALIPDRLPLTCILDVDLPTDKLQLANAANTLAQTKLASRRHIRENVLGIGQSDAMDREITQEMLMGVVTDLYAQKMSAKAQMELSAMAAQLQQAQAAGSAQSMVQGIPETGPRPAPEVGPGGGAIPPGGGAIPPGGGAIPPGGVGVQGGGPLAGPLPPRNAAQ